MIGRKNIFKDGRQNQFCVEDNMYIGWKITLLYHLRYLFSKSISNSTQPWEMQVNRASLYWYSLDFIEITYFIINNRYNVQRKSIVTKIHRNKLDLVNKFRLI